MARFPERVSTVHFPTLFLAAVSDPTDSREDPKDSEDDVEEWESEGSSPPPSLARSGAHLSAASRVPNSLTRSLMATVSLAHMAAGHRSKTGTSTTVPTKSPASATGKRRGPTTSGSLYLVAYSNAVYRRRHPPHEEPEVGPRW